MSVKSKFFRVVGGRIGESWQKMHDYMDLANKRWMASHPRVGSTLTTVNLIKFLEPDEIEDYKKHKKYFLQHWKKERAKARKLGKII